MNTTTDDSPTLTIGEASRMAGISVDWLRKITDNGWVECVRDSSGRRMYRPSEIDRLVRDRADRDARKQAKSAS